MVAVIDSRELREILDRFVREHVANQDAVTSVRLSQDAEGPFIDVKIEPGQAAELPATFEGLRVLRGERAAGHVAAGPLTLS